MGKERGGEGRGGEGGGVGETTLHHAYTATVCVHVVGEAARTAVTSTPGSSYRQVRHVLSVCMFVARVGDSHDDQLQHRGGLKSTSHTL